MDPAMNQALMALLPVEVRTALEGGAPPEELAQSLLMQRLQEAENGEPSASAPEEPWPEVGWAQREAEPLAVDQLPADQPAANLAPAISVLEERLAEIARALGACTLCLGESAECPVCGGQGGPGWAVPEPAFFQALVTPALRRLQAEALQQAQDSARRFSANPTQDNSNGHSTR